MLDFSPDERADLEHDLESGHPDDAPIAGMMLGYLRHAGGDLVGSARAYQVAIDSGDPECGPAAGLGLGTLLGMRGDFAGSGRAYQVAIDSGHPEYAPAAAAMLGDSLRSQGDMIAAEHAYLTAVELDSQNVSWPGWAFKAKIGLGELRAARGDLSGAIEIWREVAGSGDNDHAPVARCRLGDAYFEQGDSPAAALHAWQQVIESGHGEYAPFAANKAGDLLFSLGDLPGALEAYQVAIDSALPQRVPHAQHPGRSGYPGPGCLSLASRWSGPAGITRAASDAGSRYLAA